MAKEEVSAYRRAIELHNSGQRYPAASLVKDNPKAAAIFSKLVLDRRVPQAHGGNGDRQVSNLHAHEMRALASATAQNIIDAESVTQMLPDIDLSSQILVSAILSPKDLMSVNPTYVSPPGRIKLPSQVSAALINAAREYLDQVYKIKSLLPTMLHDILFRTGSYGIAVIPENAVDEIINGTGEIKMESFAEILRDDGAPHSRGILGPLDSEIKKAQSTSNRTGFGLAMERLIGYEKEGTSVTPVQFEFEKQKISTNVTVTDNFDVLKLPEIATKIRERKTRAILGRARKAPKVSMETLKLSDQKLTSTFYKNPNNRFNSMAILKSQDRLARRAVGEPLILHIASEAIIPVHVPNRPDQQIGFFILLDSDGNPISRNEGQDYYKEMSSRLSNQKDSFSSAMIQRAKNALSDNSQMYGVQQIDQMRVIYQQMFEDDLAQRLRNGIAGKNIKIGDNQEAYRIMMARSFANQHTQLLYVPGEFMTYMALRYHHNGIGKSLLEEGKILTSMRCMLLVANVMTSLRNSIGRTHVALKLDEKTPDPLKAVEMVMGEIMRVNSAGLPLGTTNPMDIKDALQRAQYQFSITGHPGLPDMEVDFDQKNDNYPKVDLELDKLLRDRNLQLFGLTPEMVDASSGADFAQSVINNAILMSKRVLTTQEKFTPQVSDNLRKVMINSADLMESLYKLIETEFDDVLKNLKMDDEEDKVKLSDGSELTKDEIKKDPMYKHVLIEEILEDFMANFEMRLPAPDLTKTDNQNDAYEKFEQLLDKGLNAWLTTDLLDATLAGQSGTHANVVRESIKAYFLREFQIQNGMLPDLAKLTAMDDDGKPEVDFASVYADHAETMTALITNLFKQTKTMRDKYDKQLEAAGVEEGGGGGFGGGYGGDSGGGGSDGGTQGFGDDFGLDGGAGGDGMGGDAADPLADPNATPPDGEQQPPEGDQNANPDEANANNQNAMVDPDEEEDGKKDEGSSQQ